MTSSRIAVVVVVVIVVVALQQLIARIKPVVTGQAPNKIPLGWKNTRYQGKPRGMTYSTVNLASGSTISNACVVWFEFPLLSYSTVNIVIV